jgi:hypothetical protein
MPDLEKLAEYLKSIFTAPVSGLLVGAGLLLVLLSFVQYDQGKLSAFTPLPKAWPAATGSALVATGILVHFLDPSKKLTVRRVNLSKGMEISAGSVQVRIKLGNIVEIEGLNQTCAIVLPANTSFLDDCVTDRNSALGAFFITHFPNDIPSLTKTMQDVLDRSDYRRADDGTYPAGTTIILPSPFDRPCPVLITASTIRRPQVGIVARPTTVCDCVRNIFSVTADKKIRTLWMPILGSGHGGLEKQEALLFLLLSIRHYARDYHHINRVEVVILEGDLPKLQDVHKLQYLSFLGG